jgi:hypothetical protein
VSSLTLGSCSPGDDQSGVMFLESPPISLAGAMNVEFRHYVATEAGYDGGNVRVSVNGGAYSQVPASDFLVNPYNRSLVGSGNTNPMAGQAAFSGTDGGRVSGSWGVSQLSLNGVAAPGDTVRLRFDFGVDGCNGVDGWYLDDVKVCSLVVGAGRVPDGAFAPGSPLVVAKEAGGAITLSWSPSCIATDTDFAVYEGALVGTFTSHAPKLCSTGGATGATFVPADGSSYYLVVPNNGTHEGSSGTNRLGEERPPAAAACLPRAVAGCP